MKLLTRVIIAGLVIVLVAAGSGCSLMMKYPHRTRYMLNLHMPHAKTVASKARLEVNNISIAPQFADFSFVYRLSSVVYTNDYYNIFFNPPAEQINQLMVKYLQSSKLFAYVSGDAGIIRSNYILHPRVVALYADYRNRQQPQAVIAVNFVLLKRGKTMHILMHQTLQSRVSLTRKDSVSLVYAWNRGLQSIMDRLATRVRGIVSD